MLIPSFSVELRSFVVVSIIGAVVVAQLSNTHDEVHNEI